MKKSRFTESQIVGVLKQVDAGAKVEDVCREHGISSATLLQLEVPSTVVWRRRPIDGCGVPAARASRASSLTRSTGKLTTTRT